MNLGIHAGDGRPEPDPHGRSDPSPFAAAGSIAEWASRFREGDESALREAFDRYGAMVHRMALSRCADQQGAEDAVCSVFVVAWRTRLTFDLRSGAGSPEEWLLGLTLRLLPAASHS